MPYVEETGALVSLLVWLAFGAIAVVPAVESLTWQTVLYAGLSLTVIRMRSSRTGRYAVARECVNFGIHLMALGVQIFYVFGNLGVLVPSEVRADGQIGPRVVGSGAYFLVPERKTHNFDEAFGSPVATVT